MSIPIIAGPVGYDSWYVKVFRNMCEIVGDPKKFVLDWIAFDKELVVHTDRLDDSTLEAVTAMLDDTVPAGIEVVQYNHTFEIPWQDINKYAACTTVADFSIVNPNYKNDLTSNGTWVYPIPSLSDASYLFSGAANMKAFDIDISHLTNINHMFSKTGLVGKVELNHPTITEAKSTLAGDNAYANYSEVVLNLPECTNIASICYHCYYTLKKVEGNLGKVTIGDYAFFGRYGTNDFSLLEFKIPLYELSSGINMFGRQALTKDSAMLILDSIPPYNDGKDHTLNLGIHRDYANDAEVLNAIEYAKTTKGWNILPSWNGKAGATGTIAAQT